MTNRFRPRRGLWAASLLFVAIGGCHTPAHTPAGEDTNPGGDGLPSVGPTLTKTQVEHARIKLEPVIERVVSQPLQALGRVMFHDLHVAHVFSPVTGRAMQIRARLGDHVPLGAPLAIFESPDVGNAFSDLAKAEVDLVAAEREFERQQVLFDAHAASQRDYEMARDMFHRTKAEAVRAREKARMFRGGKVDRISQTYTLTAPITGDVIAVNLSPGMEVQGQYTGGNAVELFTLGDLDEVWVMADVFEADIARVQLGADVSIHVVSYPDRVFQGRVEWLSGTVEAQTRTLKVRCTVKNGDKLLRPGMYASVDISTPGTKSLAIPRTAVIHLAEQVVVFVVAEKFADGRVRFDRRPVAVDESLGTAFVPVINGLKPGEEVVTAGAILLSGML